MFSIFNVVSDIAQRGLENQVVNPNDYYDSEGFLVCGVCGERRQEIRPFPDPAEGDPDRMTPLKTTTECRCDREAKEAEARRIQNEKDMEIVSSLKKASLMDAKFTGARFEVFRTNKENAKNFKLCKRYATAFYKMLENSQGLIMWGNVGTGKSFASACIANYLLERKIPVIMTSFVKMLELIQGDHEEETKLISKMNRAKLVIFDDLGAERNTDYALEKVYNIVDSRYRSGLPMILTTNLTISEMKEEMDIRYSRIYDRIFEVCYPMQFTGVSWRKKTAFEKFTNVEKFLLGDDE